MEICVLSSTRNANLWEEVGIPFDRQVQLGEYMQFSEDKEIVVRGGMMCIYVP